MTGREKILAAFSPEGTTQIPAVICYERLTIRDHWSQVTDGPWWHWYSPELDHQLRWRSSAIEKFGQDWYRLWPFYTKDEQKNSRISVEDDQVFLCNTKTNTRQALAPLVAGGSDVLHANPFPRSRDELTRQIPVSGNNDPFEILTDGRADLAAALNRRYGSEYFRIYHVISPLWMCFCLFDYEEVMLRIAAEDPLLETAVERCLQNALYEVEQAAHMGADGIWIEECMTDSVSPKAFEKYNRPYLRTLTEKIRASGMKSIYYFAGNPHGKLNLVLDAGADALSLEESKKQFTIRIDDIVDQVRGRCVLLGNLDAVEILQNAPEDRLKHEINLQIRAGRNNAGRFIMSLGSPPTPDTPLSQIRLYCDMAHEAGK